MRSDLEAIAKPRAQINQQTLEEEGDKGEGALNVSSQSADHTYLSS